MNRKQRVTRVSAYGLILNADQILLCRISRQIPGLAGQWTLPGGGIEFREDPIDAMVREVREETGLAVQSRGLAGVDSNAVETDEASYHGIRIVYVADVLGGELTYEVDGTTDVCQWWDRAALADAPCVDLVAKALTFLPDWK